MYAHFYHLKKEAFHITPDPEFLFLSPSHKEALASIIYGVQQKKGFIAITGEVGVGKTTILRSYLEQADRGKLKVIYIFNANVSYSGLLKTIHRELGIATSSDDDFEMVNQLHEVLIEEYKKGFTVVLIIDEAQNMPIKTLENLRMLSNLETSTSKLIQIVFSGQPEFERMLDKAELRQLRQRIVVKSTIRPLTRGESIDYVNFRLAKVSTRKASIFTDRALKRIAREARGIPRVINLLCENALVTALGYKNNQVTSRIAGEVIADFAGRKNTMFRRLSTVAAGMVLVLSCTLLIFFYRDVLVAALGKQPPVSLATQSSPRLTERSISSPERVAASAMAEGRDARINPGQAPVPAVPVTSPPMTEAGSGEGGGLKREKGLREGGGEGLSHVRTVRRGDTLSRLIEEVYGVNSTELITLVKDQNPSIYNANRILVGQQIVFPARGKAGGRIDE